MQKKLPRLGILVVACTMTMFADASKAQWTIFEETSIANTISGSITNGHIFKTQSGHFYEVVDYVYLYEYEYNPTVVVFSDGRFYKLLIEGFDEPLVCKCLNCGPEKARSSRSTLDPNALTIQAVQSALSILGLEPGALNGKIGPETRQALKVFRIANGLGSSDSLDVETLRSIARSLVKWHPENTQALTIAIDLLNASEDWPRRRRQEESRVNATRTPSVIESYIIDDFDGLDEGNIYRLANDQIWEQTEYWIWVWIWVNPQVLIWNEGGVYRMKVEGIEHSVSVQRIK